MDGLPSGHEGRALKRKSPSPLAGRGASLREENAQDGLRTAAREPPNSECRKLVAYRTADDIDAVLLRERNSSQCRAEVPKVILQIFDAPEPVRREQRRLQAGTPHETAHGRADGRAETSGEVGHGELAATPAVACGGVEHGVPDRDDAEAGSQRRKPAVLAVRGDDAGNVAISRQRGTVDVALDAEHDPAARHMPVIAGLDAADETLRRASEVVDGGRAEAERAEIKAVAAVDADVEPVERVGREV